MCKCFLLTLLTGTLCGMAASMILPPPIRSSHPAQLFLGVARVLDCWVLLLGQVSIVYHNASRPSKVKFRSSAFRISAYMRCGLALPLGRENYSDKAPCEKGRPGFQTGPHPPQP